MPGFDNALAGLDQGVTGFFGQWNNYTTSLVTLLVAVVSYRLVSSQEPDTHPLLLARQAQGSPVRKEGESPVYRNHASPHGMPLNTGLNVKEPGASKWSRGRNGDLRDVWRRAAQGTPDEDGKPSAGKGSLFTVLGSHSITEHKMADVSRQINLIGQYLEEKGCIRVAIYLPNSIELIASIFACSFYPGLTPVLIPFNVSNEALVSMLRRSAVDTVITAGGAFPFDAVVQAYPSMRHLIWVVDEGSRHMDWNEVPQGTGSSINVGTWQEIIEDAPAAAGTELPPVANQHDPTDMIFFYPPKNGGIEEMIRFSHANLAAGIAAHLAAIPISQRLSPADLVLPIDSLTDTYTLILTMAALFSNASVAFTAVADKSPDLVLATQGVAPTVLIASPGTLLKTHRDTTGKLSSALAKVSHWTKTRSLTEYGIMPVASTLSSLGDAYLPAIGTTPGKLRMVFTAEKVGSDAPALSSRVLSDLRVFLNARVIYSLTAAKVAGAITQTGFFDYRVYGNETDRSHFGPPITSTEIFLRDTPQHKTTDEKIEGEIVVRGPSVVGGEAALGVDGRICDDNTLAYA